MPLLHADGASTAPPGASAGTNNEAMVLQDEPTMSSDDTILAAYNIEDGNGPMASDGIYTVYRQH